jgi:hypothetical protein
VHWLKAKARHDRWTEELTLILSEMDWTERFFRYMVRKWEKLGLEQGRRQNDLNGRGHSPSGGEELAGAVDEGGDGEQLGGENPLEGASEFQRLSLQDPSEGHTFDALYQMSLAAYAGKEAAMWNRLAAHAYDSFSAVKFRQGID